MRARPVVAIDGPSGVGKSTAAKGVASALGYAYIDTGALYRCLAHMADAARVDWEDGPSLAALVEGQSFEFTRDGVLRVGGAPVGDEIRTPRMSAGASTVSKHSEVRAALLEVQRAMGRDGGVVLEGRDIGTVVFPDAELKFFLTASEEARAERRCRELAAKGLPASLESVLEEQRRRDEADRSRAVAPLRRAEDAIDIVSDGLSAAEVVEAMLEHIRTRHA